METRIHVIDAMCGMGKTSAAINYINNYKNDAKFLYITPYLDEIKRIKDTCPKKHFFEPQTYGSKLCDIKRLIKQNKNIASTHALFSHFDFEIVELMKERIKTQIVAIHVAEKNVEAARQRLQDVMQERKTHEKLKEYAFDEYVKEMNAEESKAIDELVSYNFGKVAGE